MLNSSFVCSHMTSSARNAITGAAEPMGHAGCEFVNLPFAQID